jgi:preprotein translocase subunit SecA
VELLTKQGLDPEEQAEAYQAAWNDTFAKVKAQVEVEAEKVLAAGGLYVLGTERHESRRIDNQLRGRAGRQGDAGESRFYLSLTDDLMRLFNSNAAAAIMNNPNVPDDIAIESKLVSRAIASAQSQVEGRNAEIRKNVLKYDDVLNRQREVIYSDRKHILAGDDIAERVETFMEDVVFSIVDQHIHDSSGDWNLDALWLELKNIYPVGLEISEVLEEAGNRAKLTKKWLAEEILSDAQLAYKNRADQIGEAGIRELERRVVLSVVDRKWRDHLYEMDYLKEGIGLRAMAQRDPLVEYQREGFLMFQQMMGAIREETIGFLFNLEVQVETPASKKDEELTYSAPTESGETDVHVEQTPPPAKPVQNQQQQPPQNGQGSSFFKRPN